MKRAIWATLLAASVLLTVAPGALAHGSGNPDYRSVIDKVTPNVPNVTFQVLSYDSYLQLLDQHGNEVTIYGYENEPYARILRDGTVQVNQRSPATYLNDSRFATTQVPPIADPKAPPRWKTVDDSGTFIWHDHRMHYQSTATPPQVADKSRKTKIFDYTVPIKIDSRKGAIDGTLYWVGTPSTSKLPFVVGGIVIVLAGGAFVMLTRRRRRDDDERGDGEPEESPAKEAW
jgi:hypothetical protein